MLVSHSNVLVKDRWRENEPYERQEQWARTSYLLPNTDWDTSPYASVRREWQGEHEEEENQAERNRKSLFSLLFCQREEALLHNRLRAWQLTCFWGRSARSSAPEVSRWGGTGKGWEEKDKRDEEQNNDVSGDWVVWNQLINSNCLLLPVKMKLIKL